MMSNSTLVVLNFIFEQCELIVIKGDCLFVWLVGFLMSSSTTRLYRGRVPELTSDNFTC